MKTPPVFRGRWRLVEMEMWDQDFLDLVVEAHITIDDDSLGYFQFGAVEGQVDCRFDTNAGKPRATFSWRGEDDRHPANGRGWLTLVGDNRIEGRLFFHTGDDSSLVAMRASAATTKRQPARRTARQPARRRAR